MAYFPNGTVGMIYQDQFCSRCIHRESFNRGCPVWDAHILFAYPLCNQKEDEGKQILDMLIPDNDGHADECRMFIAGPHAGQLLLL